MLVRPLFLALLSVVSTAAFASTATAAEKIDPTGTWVWNREIEGQNSRSVLKLNYKDGKLTGVYKRMGQVVPITNGKYEDGSIVFDTEGKYNDQKLKGKFHGKVSKDAINGDIDLTIEDGAISLPWVAKRGIDPADILGSWKLKITTPDGNTFEPVLKLTADGEELKGLYTSRFGEQQAKDLKLKGSELTWLIEVERDGNKFKATYKAKPAGKSITGSLEYDFDGNTGTLDFTGTRMAEKDQPAEKKPAAKGTEGKSSQVVPPSPRVIVTLKGRMGSLVIYSTLGRGPRFAVLSKKGKKTADNIDLKTLQASYPQFYETYRTSFANLSADCDGVSLPIKEGRRGFYNLHLNVK